MASIDTTEPAARSTAPFALRSSTSALPPTEEDPPRPPEPGSSRSARRAVATRIFLWMLGVGVLAIVLTVFVLNLPATISGPSSYLHPVIPILLCLVQTTAKNRQLSKLKSVKDQPVARTRYYQVAQLLCESINPVTL